MVALAGAQHPQSARPHPQHRGGDTAHGLVSWGSLPLPQVPPCGAVRASEPLNNSWYPQRPLPSWHRAPRPTSSPWHVSPGSAGTGKSCSDNEQAPHQGLECAGTWRQHTWVTYIPLLLLEYLPELSNGLGMENLHLMKALPPPSLLASALTGVCGTGRG